MLKVTGFVWAGLGWGGVRCEQNIPELDHAAAAAKSLQSCPPLCDPIDGSPPDHDGCTIPWDIQNH